MLNTIIFIFHNLALGDRDETDKLEYTIKKLPRTYKEESECQKIILIKSSQTGLLLVQ